MIVLVSIITTSVVVINLDVNKILMGHLMTSFYYVWDISNFRSNLME